MRVDSSELPFAGMVKGVGVTAVSAVVTFQMRVSPPTERVAVTTPNAVIDAVVRNCSVWPEVRAPLVTQLPPLIETWPPLIDTETGVLKPLMPTLAESTYTLPEPRRSRR